MCVLRSASSVPLDLFDQCGIVGEQPSHKLKWLLHLAAGPGAQRGGSALALFHWPCEWKEHLFFNKWK